MFPPSTFQEGFGRLITSGKIMRKLPQDFAFPLGLGSKKQQQNNADAAASKNAASNGSPINNNNNNIATNVNNNSTTTTTNAATLANGNQITNLPGSSNSDNSPRAPCQDLDTINL